MVEYGTADIDFEVPFEGTVFTIGGHVHTDNGWYVNNNGKITDVQFGDEGATVADGAVLALTTGTARKYDTDPAIDGYEMGSSFPNNIRFDVVTIREDGSVLLTRIGAGNDRIYSYAV